MPMDVFQLYRDEMPRIDAAERLKMITTVALGMGNIEKNDAQRLRNDLHRTALGKIQIEKATPQALSTMGIAVKGGKKKSPNS